MIEVRASKLGGCVRSYLYDMKLGEPELPARTKLIFAIGKALEPVVMEHAGFPLEFLTHDTVEIRDTMLTGVVLTGHPDGEDEDSIYEIKTMRGAAYRAMKKHGLAAQFPQYLIQAACYVVHRNKKGVRFLCLDKDSSEIHNEYFTLEELAPYYGKALYNAQTIHIWSLKKGNRYPQRDEDLPSWRCSPAYCRHTHCRFHFTKRKPKPKKSLTSKKKSSTTK